MLLRALTLASVDLFNLFFIMTKFLQILVCLFPRKSFHYLKSAEWTLMSHNVSGFVIFPHREKAMSIFVSWRRLVIRTLAPKIRSHALSLFR